MMSEIVLGQIFSRIARPPASISAGRENRRSHRLYTNLPIEYRVLPHNQFDELSFRGIMRNISRGGAYLECLSPPFKTPGQVFHLTLKSAYPYPERSGMVRLAAKAVVRRLDRPLEGFCFGVALEFISGPLISYSKLQP
jgi:PilZ domain